MHGLKFPNIYISANLNPTLNCFDFLGSPRSPSTSPPSSLHGGNGRKIDENSNTNLPGQAPNHLNSSNSGGGLGGHNNSHSSLGGGDSRHAESISPVSLDSNHHDSPDDRSAKSKSNENSLKNLTFVGDEEILRSWNVN